MHKIIRFLVKADSKDAALAEARQQLDNMVEHGYAGIDYGTFFDEEGSTVSGKGRWGDHAAAVKLTTKVGMKWLLQGLTLDYQEYSEAVDEVLGNLKKHGKQIVYNDSMMHWTFKRAGSHKWVVVDYNYVGRRSVNYSLSEGIDKMWIVPCDIHF